MNLHYAFENPASVYDEEALTALELAGRQGAKINEVIEDQNSLRAYTEKTVNVTIPAEVVKEIDRCIKSGDFDEAIRIYTGNLEKRVDNLIDSIPEGGTTMDAEIIDARTDPDGHVYGSAGAALRATTEALINQVGVSRFAAERLYGGTTNYQANRIMSPVIWLDKGVRATAPAGFKVAVQTYEDANGATLLNDSGWQQNWTAGRESYVSFRMCRDDAGVMAPIDILALDVRELVHPEFEFDWCRYLSPDYGLEYNRTRVTAIQPVKFDHDVAVHVPSTHKIYLHFWADDEPGAAAYLSAANWSQYYHVPRNTYVSITIARADDGEMYQSDIDVMKVDPLMISGAHRHAVLSRAGFYESVKASDRNGAPSNHYLTAHALTLERPVEVLCNTGYACQYDVIDATGSVQLTSGWLEHLTIPGGQIVNITFKRSDGGIIDASDLHNACEFRSYFDGSTPYTDNDDRALLLGILSTMKHGGIVDGSYGFTRYRMLSDPFTLPRPLCVKVSDGKSKITYHVAGADGSIAFDSTWKDKLYLPAAHEIRLMFKNDQEVVNIWDLLVIDVYKGDQALNPMVKSVAHRGFSRQAPENTEPAFRAARAAGFRYVECDVQFTSDNVAVLCHDQTIDRTSNGSGAVSSLSFAQLDALDFGAWFNEAYAGTKILTLDRFMQLAKELGVHPYIEVKALNPTQANADAVYSIVKKHRMEHDCTIIVNTTGVNLPKDVRRAFALGELNDSMINYLTGMIGEGYNMIADIDYAVITDELVDKCIEANIPLECWTVDTTDQIKALNPYISGVTSNELIYDEAFKEVL